MQRLKPAQNQTIKDQLIQRLALAGLHVDQVHSVMYVADNRKLLNVVGYIYGTDARTFGRLAWAFEEALGSDTFMVAVQRQHRNPRYYALQVIVDVPALLDLARPPQQAMPLPGLD